ncbi:MAG: hypothetical protein EA427_17245, partial [Spirochaetaceae bacterium]
AASFIGRTPWEVSRDGRLLQEAHQEAYRFYRHQPVTVGIDIYNVEAEAYGATVEGSDGTEVPSIHSHIFGSCAEILDQPHFDPERAGRCPLVMDAASALNRVLPDAQVNVPLGGPFSIASNLVGFETLLMELITEEELVGRALLHLAEGQVRFGRAVLDRGLGISLFESAATPPMLSPASFAAAELPALSRIMDEIREQTDRAPACIMGGNTEPILDSLLAARPGFLVCPSETDQEAFIRRMQDHREVAVRINMSVEILARGDREILEEEIRRVCTLCASRPNTVVGTGVLPFNVDPETVRWVGERVVEYLSGRVVLNTAGDAAEALPDGAVPG